MIDIFFEKLPVHKLHHSDPSAFYAVKEVKNPAGNYFHVLLTEAQYKYRVKNRLTCTTWREMVAAKPERTHEVSDEKGDWKIVPEHVFGESVYDPKEDEDIIPTKVCAATRAQKEARMRSLEAELAGAVFAEIIEK